MSDTLTAKQQTITLPSLAAGEIYAGILLKDGTPSHHLVLLPNDLKPSTWKQAIAWAAKQGGELPTHKEQALLFANAAGEFEKIWYWSSEQYAGDESAAWAQGFGNGLQYYGHKASKLRSRAVRRIPIEEQPHD